jgi:hypothetical protein
MVGLNIQTLVLCVFSRGKKWRLEKGKIIQEFLRISKIPLSGIQIEAIKNRQNTIFFSINFFFRNSSFILSEKKGGEDFRLIF